MFTSGCVWEGWQGSRAVVVLCSPLTDRRSCVSQPHTTPHQPHAEKGTCRCRSRTRSRTSGGRWCATRRTGSSTSTPTPRTSGAIVFRAWAGAPLSSFSLPSPQPLPQPTPYTPNTQPRNQQQLLLRVLRRPPPAPLPRPGAPRAAHPAARPPRLHRPLPRPAFARRAAPDAAGGAPRGPPADEPDGAGAWVRGKGSGVDC